MKPSIPYVETPEFEARVEDVIREIRMEMAKIIGIPAEFFEGLPKYPSAAQFIEQMRVWSKK